MTLSPPVIPVPSPPMAALSHFAKSSPYALPFTSPAWQRSADSGVDTDHKAARMHRCQGVMRWERSYLTGARCSVFHCSTEAKRFSVSLCVCLCAIECSPDSLIPAAVPQRGNGRQRARRWRITLSKDTTNTLQRCGGGSGGTSTCHMVGFNMRLHFLTFQHKKVPK